MPSNDPYAIGHSGPLVDPGTKYKFRLREELTFYFYGRCWPKFPAGRACADARGRVWFRFGDQTATVSKGYESDGCSPKWRIFGVWVGTPDFNPGTIAASHLHDPLWQFMHLEGFPFNRQLADFGFYKVMEEDRFKLRHVYYNAVRAAGPFTYKGGNPTLHWA